MEHGDYFSITGGKLGCKHLLMIAFFAAAVNIFRRYLFIHYYLVNWQVIHILSRDMSVASAARDTV